jgi:hypothetical protein
VFFKICITNVLQMRITNVIHFKPIPTLFTPLHTRASGLKRWTKNSKRLDDYIKKYNQDKLPIPVKIEQSVIYFYQLYR